MVGKAHRQDASPLGFQRRGGDPHDPQLVVAIGELRCVEAGGLAVGKLGIPHPIHEELEAIDSAVTRQAAGASKLDLSAEHSAGGERLLTAGERERHLRDGSPGLAQRVAYHQQLVGGVDRLIEGFDQARTAGVVHLDRRMGKLGLIGVGFDDRATGAGGPGPQECGEGRLPGGRAEDPAEAGEVFADRSWPDAAARRRPVKAGCAGHQPRHIPLAHRQGAGDDLGPHAEALEGSDGVGEDAATGRRADVVVGDEVDGAVGAGGVGGGG